MVNPAPATELEMEAINTLWRVQHPDAKPGPGPTPEESLLLLQDVRNRLSSLEQEALSQLARATRNAPSRSGANSKYMRLFWLGFMPVVALILLAIYIYLEWGRAWWR